MQDPDDEIIANVASLKNGVATHLVLGDNMWYAHSEPREYVLSSYLEEPSLPHGEAVCAMVQQLNDLAQPLQERAVAHLYACIVFIAKRSSGMFGSSASSEGGKAGRGRGGQHLVQQRSGVSTDASSSQETGSAGELSLPEGKVVSSSSAGQGAGSKASAKSRLSQALNSTASTIELISSTGSINNHAPSAACDLSASDERRDEDEEAGPQSPSKFSQHLRQPQVAPPQFSSQREFLDYFCSLRVTDHNLPDPHGRSVSVALTPHTKLWVALARIDGGSGQLLGQAARAGYDGFRAWLCSMIVWSAAGRATPDSSLPRKRSTLQQAVAELSEILAENESEFLGTKVEVTFVRDALQAVARRTEAPLSSRGSGAARRVGHRGGEEEEEVGDLEENAQLNGSGRPASSVSTPHSRCCEQPVMMASSAHSSCSHISNSAGMTSASPAPHVGHVVPLHCGHNGWPSAA